MTPGKLLGAAARGWRGGRGARGRLAGAAKGGFSRAWMRFEAVLPAVGTWLLILLGVAVYSSAVALAGIAVFRDYLPDWFMEWVRNVFFAGNKKVDLTLQLLEDWGLIDLLKNTVIGAIVFCVALFGLLILVHLIVLWARNRKRKRIEEVAQALKMPRIRLKRPLTISIGEEAAEVHHRYDIQIELVVKKTVDIKPVIAILSNLKTLMAKDAEAVIRSSYARVDPEAMAAALSRVATEATGAAVDRVEVGHITHLEIERATGSIVSTRNSQAAGSAEASAADAMPAQPPGAAPTPSTAAATGTAAGATMRTPQRRDRVAVPLARPGAAIARILPQEPQAPEAPAAAPPADASAAAASPSAAGDGGARLKGSDGVEVVQQAPGEPAAPGIGVDLKKLKEVMSSLRS